MSTKSNPKEKKIMFKKTKVFLALALALTLCFANIPAVFAAQPTGTESAPAQAAITKLLMVPHGTAVPSTTFKFTVTPVSIDGNPSAKPPVQGIGSDGTVSLIFPPSAYYTLEETIDDTDYYYLETEELFGGVNFEHAGVYVYEIEEAGNTFTNEGTPPVAPYEKMDFSLAKYTVEVYVKDGEYGTYIYFIGAVRTVNDDDTYADVKVDPTPGEESEDFDYSQMIFTNTYVKANGGTDPQEPDNAALSVSKQVLGEFASKTIYFIYDMKVFTPSLIGAAETYTAYVVEDDPMNPGKYRVVTTDANFSGTIGMDGSIRFPSDTLVTFNLRANQYLVFIDTPVGVHYEIAEKGTAGYIPSVVVTYDGTPGGDEIGDKGAGLVLPHNANYFYKDTLYVGEGANSADFLNENDTTTPTGLDLNDLPFIGMIILAIGAAVAFIVVKVRKRKTD